MKIGLFALNYIPHQMGGIETYFQDLLVTLQVIDTKNDYYIFCNAENQKAISLTNSRFKKVVIRNSKAHRALRKFHLSPSTGQAIAKYSLDVAHFPFQIIEPEGVEGKKVISVMDIQQEYFPEFFSDQDIQARRQTFAPSVKQADVIISISDFTKQTLVEKYKADPAKIKTVYLAYNKDFYNRKKSTSRMNLPKTYFYYPAATWPHKNHLRLLEAFSKLVKKQPEAHLVFSGIRKQNSELITSKIAELGLETKVHFLGYMEREDLKAVYQNAVGLVFPSLFEGFGIPILEAMACGCPVVASNSTSVPEVGGNAVLYFDPTKVASIADAMDKLLTNPELKKKLITKGLSQAEKFSNIKMAQQTLDVYKKVNQLT